MMFTKDVTVALVVSLLYVQHGTVFSNYVAKLFNAFKSVQLKYTVIIIYKHFYMQLYFSSTESVINPYCSV